MSELAVTLTVEQLGELVSKCVRSELAKCAPGAAKEVLTLQEAAEFLARHPRKISELVDREGLPAHYISEREPRFKRTELLAWLDSRPTAPKRSEEG
jgi:excisionase family DNA binding protein